MNEFRYDALLVLTYGGPESPDGVPAYLKRLFAGKSPSPESLARGEKRYALIGGKSPIMEEARLFAASLREDFPNLPVYLGCLYAPPFPEESLREIAAAGHRRVLVLITSPFGIEGVRRRYTERLARAAESAPKTEFFPAPPFYAHPKWIRAQADLVLSLLAEEALEEIRWEGEEEAAGSVLLFTAHSLPLFAAGGYPDELRKCCRAVTEAIRPLAVPWHLVYQSRSGPADSWLGPDAEAFVSRIGGLHPGTSDCLVLPIGFFFENLETVVDLDIDLAAAVRKENLRYRRAPAAWRAPEVAEMVREFLTAALPTIR